MDLAVLAPRLAEEDAGRRVAVLDGFDVHGYTFSRKSLLRDANPSPVKGLRVVRPVTVCGSSEWRPVLIDFGAAN